MRNLDESKIYYLGDLSEDERKCLYNITENHKILDTDWKYILFQLGRWVVGKSPRKAINAKELFSERFPEVGQTKEETEKNSNQIPDDSKLVSEREVPISIKIAETEREIILKKISEQDLEMIDSKSKNNFKDITDSISDLLEYKNEKYGNTILEPLNIFSGKSKAGHEIDKKLSRVKNSKELRKNDVVDIIGYLVLTCKEFGWNNFDEFKD